MKIHELRRKRYKQKALPDKNTWKGLSKSPVTNNNLNYEETKQCGLGRVRTCDLMVNSHLLYQLSYQSIFATYKRCKQAHVP